MAIKPNKKGVVTGTKKKDKITWSSSKLWKKAITVNAGNGNDKINFKKSKYKNKLYGQAGDDTIYGGTSNDVIKGGAGKDYLYGYNGNDKLYGDDGKDYIYGGNGNDKIWGGKGNDKINAGAGNNTIYYNFGDGNDTIVNGSGSDTLVLGKKVKILASIYEGNNLELYVKGNGPETWEESKYNRIILKDYVKKGDHSVKYVQIGNKTKTLESIAPENEIYVNYKNKVKYGTPVKDRIWVNESGNEIYTGKGNDFVHLTGSTLVHFKSGDGADTVCNLGGILIFDDEKTINNLDITAKKVTEEDYGYDTTLTTIKYNNGKDAVITDSASYIMFGKDIYIIGNYDENWIQISERFVNRYAGAIDNVDLHIIGAKNYNNVINSSRCEIADENGYGYFEKSAIVSDITTYSGNDYLKVMGTKVYAGSGNDTIIAEDGSQHVDGNGGIYYGEAGNDSIYISGAYFKHEDYAIPNNGIIAEFNGGAGDDKYFVENVGNITIKDTSGNDTLNILNSDNSLKTYININANGDYSDLHILNFRDNGYWDANNVGNIKIKDYFMQANTVKTIGVYNNPQYQWDRTIQQSKLLSLGDGYTLSIDSTKIAAIVEDVSGWLSGTSYADCNEVFNSGNYSDITTLVAKFNDLYQWN